MDISQKLGRTQPGRSDSHYDTTITKLPKSELDSNRQQGLTHQMTYMSVQLANVSLTGFSPGIVAFGNKNHVCATVS